MKRKQHILTDYEVLQIKYLGFQFLNVQTAQEKFINTHFLNFALFDFLSEIDSALKSLSTAVVFKTVELKITISPQIHILYYSEDYDDENNGLAFSRIFTRQDGELLVKHDFF